MKRQTQTHTNKTPIQQKTNADNALKKQSKVAFHSKLNMKGLKVFIENKKTK